MHRNLPFAIGAVAVLASLASPSYALNGGTLRFTPKNGWKGFEVISVGENPAGDGFNYAMPSTNDGVGAWIAEPGVLRIVMNHENTDSSISEINLNLANYRTALRNTITSGTTGGGTFVTSARQAYGRWSNDAGATWTPTSDITTTSFYRFCSGQSFQPNTFGLNRGFVDPIYLTGEEGSTNRLFALDLANRDFYRLSGVTGSRPGGGIGGMPTDAWENAALLDTGETNYVAMLLSPDGGTSRLQLYVGEKGKDRTGAAGNDILSRNGLAYGSYYYLKDTLPTTTPSTDGLFDTNPVGALAATKMEDIDTNPNDPTQLVLGNENFGLFTFDFNLDFSAGSFNAATSGFSVTRILPHVNGLDGMYGDADNVDWSKATTLGGVNYPNGLIFTNEDSETTNGETWVNLPDGSGLSLIGDNVAHTGSTETSGVLDISELVGYRAGSVVLVANQGSTTSLTTVIHPFATLLADYNSNGTVDAADYTVWRDTLGQTGAGLPADGNGNGVIDPGDYDYWVANFEGVAPSAAGGQAVPEPRMGWLLGCGLAVSLWSRRGWV